MLNKETFGAIIRRLREENKLPIRKVAAVLDTDPSTLSKIERNERRAKKDWIEKLAKFYNVNSKVLWVAYLSDKVIYEVCEEKYGIDALKVAEQKIYDIKKQNNG
jgi:HTH-type transcriptional regulator, competence development regulator